MSDLKKRFMQEAEEKRENAQVLVAAVRLPTGATEVITNSQNIQAKLDYYASAYDDDFKLKTNSAVSIVGFLLV